MTKRTMIEMLLASVCFAVIANVGCSSSGGEDWDRPEKNAAASTKAKTDGGAAQDGGDTSATCSWDARLDRGDDAPRGACHAKRHVLSCAVGGATEICLSDEAHCADADESACEDKCQPDEYAIACGAVGPDTGDSDAPAACHGAINTPGGTFYMCCPCE